MSSEIGVKVKNKLQEIHEKAKKNNQNTQSKMLVVGHSLGGNLLLKGMLPEINTRLDEHKNTINPEGRSSTEFSPILGDLTVLINPASEARNWVRIQEKMHEIIGVSKTTPHPDHTGWRNAFIKKQKPVVLSITATENWSQNELKSLNGQKPEYDDATGATFPRANFFRQNSKDRKAVGHYWPVYKDGDNDGYLDKRAKSDPYGTTHEIVLNSGTKTSVKGLNDIRNAECSSVDGWLVKARTRAVEGIGNAEMWDTGSEKSGERELLLPYQSNDTKYNQVRRALSLNGSKNSILRAVVPYNAPFWNARVLHSVAEHNTFVIYPTWCLLNQMILDDMSASNYAVKDASFD